MIRSVLLLSLVFGGSVIFLALAYRSTQSEPEFYSKALNVESVVSANAGEELEVEALRLRNQIVDEGEWSATFTDSQINGWLAMDLPEKFSETLPKSVANPRLQFSQGKITLACRYQTQNFGGIVQFECEPFLTDSPNVIGVKICELKTGWVPLPTNQWMTTISRRAMNSGLQIRWTQREGQPVALIELPLDDHDDGRRRVLEGLAVLEGQLQVTGRSEGEVAEEGEVTPHVAEDVSRDDQSIRQ